MATLSTSFIIVTIFLGNIILKPVSAANWCVARSDASYQALQTALAYACGAGADCSPILSSGLCFLPNTMQAHASYAFNSYFQRKGMAPGSCDFSGTATITKTDPSYGSCVYPSSSRTAGTPTSTNSTGTNSPKMPSTNTPASGDGTAGLNPGTTPTLPEDNYAASSGLVAAKILVPVSLFLVILLTL